MCERERGVGGGGEGVCGEGVCVWGGLKVWLRTGRMVDREGDYKTAKTKIA